MTNKEWAQHQLAKIDLWYSSKRNNAHAELWRTGNSAKFDKDIVEAQNGRFDSLKALFYLIHDKEDDELYIRAVDPLECLRTYDGTRP